MQALQIQWRAQPRRTTPLSLVLALAAALCASWVALDYADADAEAQSLQARQVRLDRMQRNNQRTSTKTTRSADAGKTDVAARDGAQATATMQTQLQRPWGSLLQTLEDTQVKDVALLHVDAQAANRTLRLVGEAKGMEPALAYARALGQSPDLKKVVLTGQESKLQNGVPVVRFALDAAWGEGNAPREGVAP